MSLLRTEIADRVATITLTNPERRNALYLDTADALVDAIEELERADVGAMVITGEGSAFCAGADLDVLERADSRELVRIYKAFTRVYTSHIPSIAAINGPAVGAGFNLALCCDLRIAAESARFDAAFLRLAVHPGGGSTWLLTRQIGVEATIAMTLFQEVVDGSEAARIGLVWRCVPDDEVVADATKMARRVAALPPALARKVNHTITRMLSVENHGQAMQYESEEQMWSLRQPEAKAAIAALRERISAD
jgi:enoyl-CoA hydratase